MSSSNSSCPDSAIPVQDAEIVGLKLENAQYPNFMLLQQESESWHQKFVDERKEKLDLAGANAKSKREIQSVKDRCKEMETKLLIQHREVASLTKELSKARSRLRDSQVSSQPSESKTVNQSIEAELAVTRQALKHTEADNLKLSNIHKNMSCESFKVFKQRQLQDAMDEKIAAEAEVDALQHLGEANKLIQEQNVALQSQLAESMQETRKAETKAYDLQMQIETHKNVIQKSELKTARLEKQIRDLESEADDWRAIVEANATVTPLSSFSVIQAVNTPPRFSIKGKQDDRIHANIAVKISAANHKSWSLLKRLSSAITPNAGLDILGPQDLVENLVERMKACENDHAEQTAAATHWQMIATKVYNEVDELNRRPACMLSGHQGLKEELAAKDVQLQLQANMVAQWQRKMANVRTFIEDANAEMRANGIRI